MEKSNPSEKEIFAGALQRSTPAERVAYLRTVCGEDAELRHRLEALLEAHEQASEFLKAPAAGVSSKTLLITTGMIPVTEKPGDKIGRYKLREQIGEGGCGVVYVADQEEPVRRRVALKVIKLGMDTKQVVARFEAERQALALMDHPHIAKVLDAGATDTGRPYFVMELVRGIKITDYCDKHNLSTEERLKLFIQVCSAIQHAHQKGIIHRDIKPSNILVTLHDGTPVPKVIDFGIAKATTDQRLTDKTIYTAFEQFIGTPAYMSPEQAEMSGLDIDTRSDIYSLGVLLYELLTGRPPFDAATLLKAGLDQMRRIIREQEPQRPSTRLSTLEDADLTAVASHRHVEPPKLVHLIRGDLDWIVMKALEKDRVRRYETATGFAQDIQRHLSSEPVVARPPNQLYRLKKVIQRNKLAFAAVGVVLATLLLGLGISSRMFVLEKQARQRAVAAERQQSQLHAQAESERARAETERNEAQLQSAQAKREQGRADEQARIAVGTLQQMKLQRAEDLFKSGNASLAPAMLAQVLRQDPSNSIAAQRIMSALTYRNFLLPRFQLPGSNQVAEFSPDGRWLACAGADRRLMILDARNGKTLVGPVEIPDEANSIEFNRDGTQLLTVSSNLVSIWNAVNLACQQESVHFSRPIYSAHFTPHGPRVISVEGATVSVLHGLNGSVLVGPLEHGSTDAGWVDTARFSRDGNRLIVGYGRSEIRIWNATNGVAIANPWDEEGSKPSLVIGPDGKSFAVGNSDILHRYVYSLGIVPPRRISLDTPQDIDSMDFSADEKSVAVRSKDGGAGIWDATTGKWTADIPQHFGTISSIEFGPTGKNVLTSSTDQTIRLWDAGNGQPLNEARHYMDQLEKVRVSPDGGSVIAISETDAQVWDLRPSRALADPGAESGEGGQVRVSPDGRLELRLNEYVGYHNLPVQASIIDRQTQRPVAGRLRLSASIMDAKFSPDSRHLLFGLGAKLGVKTGGAEIIDARSGKRLLELAFTDENDRTTDAVSFSPDGRLIATGSRRGRVLFWNAVTGQPILKPLQVGYGISGLAFSLDGSLLLMRIWGPRGHTAQVWNVRTAERRLQLHHYGGVNSAAFSADGVRIVTAGNDGAARIWEVSTGMILRDLWHETPVFEAIISPNRELLATGSRNSARVWDVATGQPISESMLHPNVGSQSSLESLEFTDGGTRLKAWTWNGAYQFDLPDAPLPAPSWLADLAEAVGGLSFDGGMQVERAPASRLLAIKGRIQERENSTTDPYVRWAKWFFADRTSRNISPFSKFTIRDYLANCASQESDKSAELDTVEQLASGDPSLRDEILKARERFQRLAQVASLQNRADTLA